MIVTLAVVWSMFWKIFKSGQGDQFEEITVVKMIHDLRPQEMGVEKG